MTRNYEDMPGKIHTHFGIVAPWGWFLGLRPIFNCRASEFTGDGVCKYLHCQVEKYLHCTSRVEASQSQQSFNADFPL